MDIYIYINFIYSFWQHMKCASTELKTKTLIFIFSAKILGSKIKVSSVILNWLAQTQQDLHFIKKNSWI